MADNESAEARLREALIALDERLRSCGSLHTAEDAYDSFYQDIVSEALSAGGDEERADDEYHHQYILDDYIDLCRKGFPKGWHMVCHNFQNEAGTTAIRYLTDGKTPVKAFCTGRQS